MEIRVKCLAVWVAALFLWVCFFDGSKALGADVAPLPEMPAGWKIISDFQVPTEQVKAMSCKLGAHVSSVRNTVYDVKGKRVQLNVIVTPDSRNAEKLMMKLRSMKSDDALLRKGLIVYEFVGENDVLPLISQGRNYLESK